MTIHNLFGKQPIDISELSHNDLATVVHLLFEVLGAQVFEHEEGVLTVEVPHDEEED